MFPFNKNYNGKRKHPLKTGGDLAGGLAIKPEKRKTPKRLNIARHTNPLLLGLLGDRHR